MLDEFEQTSAPKNRVKGALAALISVGILLGLVAGGYFVARDTIDDFISRFQVEDYDGAGGPPVQITIEPEKELKIFSSKRVILFSLLRVPVHLRLHLLTWLTQDNQT